MLFRKVVILLYVKLRVLNLLVTTETITSICPSTLMN